MVSSRTSHTQALYSQGTKQKPPGLLLAIDPGKSTGWYQFRDGMPALGGIIRDLDSLIDRLEAMEPPDVIIMEKYKLFSWKAQQQSGSKMEVAQAEGVVESYARRYKILVVEQSPQILPIAKMWSRVDHNAGSHRFSHDKAAHNHGFYWLVSQNMIPINAPK